MTESFRMRQRSFREQEIERAARAVLGDVGCRAFTMDAVASRLGISKATLYQHFHSRDALLRRLVSEAAREATDGARAAAAQGPPDERLRRAARYLVRRYLGLGREGSSPSPCCLAEVECPFLDHTEFEALLRSLGAPSSDAVLGFGRVLRALSSTAYARRRALGQRPAPADARAILRFLLRDS